MAASLAPFPVLCLRCEREILAHPAWVGREVDCPHCLSTLRVPGPSPDGRPVKAEPPSLAPGRVFNFACPRCDCLLEANTSMSGHLARCPTCAARFLVPDVHGRTGLPRRAELLPDDYDPAAAAAAFGSGQAVGPEAFGRTEQGVSAGAPSSGAPAKAPAKPLAGKTAPPPAARGEKTSPVPAKAASTAQQPPPAPPPTRAEPETAQPMHAYAASGLHAPTIVRNGRGEMQIECPRCNGRSPVDADRCPSCGTPFTLEASPSATAVQSAGQSTAAVSCGLLGLLLFPLLVPGLLAIVFGLRSLTGGLGRASLGAVLGLLMGAISVAGGVLFWATR